ncbi:hypothetical protein F9L33_13285 [Amylibacter sp. SFDW26]|uniref:hypothetical protein n=1 Tax=Amylibacter sp. SFDW26 TaxID=2652722 RepID=UPI00126177E5|nr:hypothetical protein [Amylibacter sp. SFDW26]KAB7610279.1 hypothetical protein F9L33_13285 [Amylibacter sp. SFDW26]
MDTSSLKYPVSIKAFISALVIAPALFTFLMLWSPMVAGEMMIAGWPPYFILGGPAFWYTLRRFGPSYRYIALASLFAVGIIPVIACAAYFLSLIDSNAFELILAGVTFGGVVALIWGCFFLFLYKRFRRMTIVPKSEV